MAVESYQALVLNGLNQPLELVTKPMPRAAQGTVVVKVLAAYILPYAKSVYAGNLPYTMTFPLVPSSSAIARVYEAGPDTTILKPGMLVLADMTIKARDEPANVILMGLHGAATPDLMAQWSNGTFAEYAVFPMENVFPLDETRLCGELGYSIEDLILMRICQVPFGGLATIDVKPGETVIVCPATGRFGGAAVVTAIAMGAKVIACGRNTAALEQLAGPLLETKRIKTVVMSGDVDRDTKTLSEAAGGGLGADCYVDFSPPQAATSTHITACLHALRPKGRAVFNGGSLGDVSIPYLELMIKSLSIHGRFMYEREHTAQLIKLTEAGLLPLGKRVNYKTVGAFKLHQFKEALDMAEKEAGWGKQVIFTP